MSHSMDGGCQCGRVRYRVEGEPLGLCRILAPDATSIGERVRDEPRRCERHIQVAFGRTEDVEVKCDSGRNQRRARSVRNAAPAFIIKPETA